LNSRIGLSMFRIMSLHGSNCKVCNRNGLERVRTGADAKLQTRNQYLSQHHREKNFACRELRARQLSCSWVGCTHLRRVMPLGFDLGVCSRSCHVALCLKLLLLALIRIRRTAAIRLPGQPIALAVHAARQRTSAITPLKCFNHKCTLGESARELSLVQAVLTPKDKMPWPT
jgi:hypothetical protein